MKPRLRPLLTFAAILLAVAGGVSARDPGHGPLSPRSRPELVVGGGVASDFSALIHRNRNGHIIRITRGSVTQFFARGTGGRITSATSNVAGAPSFSYPDNTHDAQGRRTAAHTNRGNWTYGYRGGVNGDGQLHTATHTGDWDFVYNTDGIGRRLSASTPASNGILLPTGNAQDALNRFLSTPWTQQRILRASLDREADVEITQTHALPTLLPGLPADPQLPLRDIVFPLTSPGTQGGWSAWSITGTLGGGGDPGAAPNRKAKLAGLVWFPPAEETFTYDAAGNRSGSARWSYTYDGLNRLTRAVNKELATSPEAYDVLFTYDAEGRRHSKTSKRYSNGSLKAETHTTWIWDGWHPVVERIKDKHGQMLVERKLVWGPDLSGQVGGAGLPAIALATAGGAGGLLLIRETNHSFDGRPPVTTDLLPLYDGSGNIVGLANPAGELLAEYWYGPFGELLEATGPKANTNPWRWATKSLDRETGLVYFGLRYYDPATGQWLSREPLGEGESLNLYAYCHNDPINRVDVLGAAEYSNKWLQWAKYEQEKNKTVGGFFNFMWCGVIGAAVGLGDGQEIAKVSINESVAEGRMDPVTGFLGRGVIFGGTLCTDVLFSPASYVAAGNSLGTYNPAYIVASGVGQQLESAGSEGIAFLSAPSFGGAYDNLENLGNILLFWKGTQASVGRYRPYSPVVLSQPLENRLVFQNQSRFSPSEGRVFYPADPIEVPSLFPANYAGGPGAMWVGENRLQQRGTAQPLALPVPSGTNPYPAGIPLNAGPAPAGMIVEMVMAPGQPITKPGAFATLDTITDVAYARTQLAIIPEFKPQIGYVQRYAVAPGTPIQWGPVGPQTSDGIFYPGGGTQIQILVPAAQRPSVLIPVGPARPIR